METIVLCAVFQNAAATILEWLAFHRLVGIDRFVLYDLGSRDGTASLIARSRFGHQTTVLDWSRGSGRAAAEADMLARHVSGFTWVALIQTDEFMHPLDGDMIRPLLSRYQGFSAVLLRRWSFLPPRHPIRPGQFVIGSSTDRLRDAPPEQRSSLSLLRAASLRVQTGGNVALTGEACDARGDRVPPDSMAVAGSDDVLVLHHYSAAVAEADGGNPPAHEIAATVPDRRIVRFAPRLRAILHDTSLTAQPAFPAVPPPQAQPASPGAAAPAPTRPAAPAPTTAALQLGIGIITYNRRAVLSETLDRVQRHTRHPRTVVAVADDGSTDGTLDMLRARQVLTVTGRNMSVAWNKNRALFLLAELQRCDVVLLLEDDAYPERDGWEVEWMRAAIRWGHANVAARWIEAHVAPAGGAGTLEDPMHSNALTAQCSVFSREALLFGGYFDTRFRGYGHEHVEHTGRLLRMGYGGTSEPINGQPGPFFKLLWGGIGFHMVPPVVEAKEAQAERNLLVAQALAGDFSYRAPWQNEDEAKQFREEMRHTLPRPAL
jgi:hypothetical protein